MQKPADSLDRQYKILGRYLLKQRPDAKYKQLFIDAVESSGIPITKADNKLITFCVKHTWSIGFIDAGLALVSPQSELRHRLYLLFAIFESTPDYSDLYLPKKQPWFHIFKIGLVGILAGIKALVGVLMIKVIG